MTQPRNMVALDIGNKRRLERVALHRHIRGTQNFEASCIEIAKTLEPNPPLCVGSMRVEELLQWIYCLGGNQPRRKRRLIHDALEAAACSEFRLVRELTPRQRTLIVDVLTSFAYGRQAA